MNSGPMKQQNKEGNKVIDVLKEYLVSLGFRVDANSYNQTLNSMKQVDNSVSKLAGNAVSQFAAAGAAVTTFVAVVNAGLAKFVVGLAKADLENEKFARKMWMGREAAEAYNNSLKAMGATLEDLWASPELFRNFVELRNLSMSLRPPEEFKAQMRMVREIIFEFQKMRLEMTYALQWIGYYLIKYMEAPLRKVKLGLKEINSLIIKEMPHWTKQVAQVMSWFVRMGIAIVRGSTDIYKAISKVSRAIPEELKLIGTALAALGLIIKTGPLGLFIALFTAALVLLDDFYTYIDGGEAQLGPFWDVIMKGEGVFGDIGEKIEWAKQKVSELYTALSGMVKDFIKSGVFNVLGEAIKSSGKAIESATELLIELVKWLDKVDAMKYIGYAIQGAFSVAAGAVEALNIALKTTKELLSGDLIGAVEVTKKEIVEFSTRGIDRQEKLMPDLDKKFKELLTPLAELLNKLPKPSDFMQKESLISSSNEYSESNYSNEYNETNNFSNQHNGGDNYSTSHIYDQGKTVNNRNVSHETNINVYGNEPNATARAVERNIEDLYTRNFQGVLE